MLYICNIDDRSLTAMRKRINIILLFLIFLICGFALQKSKEREYKQYSIEEVTRDVKIDSFNIYKSFTWKNNDLLIFGSSSKLYRTGVGFVQYNTSTKKVKFNAIKEGGSEDFIVPYFFKTNDPLDPILMLCNVGADYTYGVRVYKMDNNKIHEIGQMNIAADTDPYENSTDPVPFTTIITNGDSITFSFTKPIAIDFQGENEKAYKAGQLKYIYKDNKFIKRQE